MRRPGRPTDPNPDVDDVLARNAEACEHPESAVEDQSVAVGSGRPGVIGCHMETFATCRICGKRWPYSLATKRHWDEVLKDFPKVDLSDLDAKLRGSE